MNYQLIGFTVGRILLIEAVLLFMPVLVAAIYGEAVLPFVLPMLLLALTGGLLSLRRPGHTALYARDGFAVVALAWILMSAFGALPFVLSGDIPHYVDAFFETVSGFTTTGATVLQAVEPLSRSCLFWRSFTQWIGGMGVLVFAMAVLPMSDGRGIHLLRAEMPGPAPGKMVSRMGDMAKILYGIYLAMVLVQMLLLMAGGMSLFDASVHAFGTIGTAGFSVRNASVGAYGSVYTEVVIGVFMILSGINFQLHYLLLRGRFREVFRSDELKVYLGIMAISILLVAVNISGIYGSIGTSLRHAFFQVSSMMTTTGFATADFSLWPTFSRMILMSLMFVGCCAGSTGGGLKVVRILMLAKAARCEMRRMLHPQAVSTVRIDGKLQPEKAIQGVQVYITIYFAIFVSSLLLLFLEGFDLVTTFTALVACINNTGLGLEMVGPTGNFAEFSALGKLLLSFNMLVGRLEIFPMLLLAAPSIWKRHTFT